ncbi:MAG: hypothetical protein V3T77_07965, partial [Planctomycetota bacterium]
QHSGLRTGLWVNAGSDPISAQLSIALEPVPGSRVMFLGNGSPECWRAVEVPRDWSENALPTAIEGVWYCREAWTGGDPRGEEWTPGPAPLALYFHEPPHEGTWPEAVAGDVWVTWDAGGPSAGAAIQAGLGLGWWRDPRILWRKRRPLVPYQEWRAELALEDELAEENDA